jgi:pimeloyl-ACP methyl ester carboxylesterase
MPGVARTVQRMLDVLGCDRIDALGVSLGGVVAQQLARQAPARVHRLMLAATGPGPGTVVTPRHFQDSTHPRSALTLCRSRISTTGRPAMFSKAEQRRLAEIEALLRADDPAFVQQFDARYDASQSRRILAFLGFLLAVMITAVALIAGSVGIAILGLCGVGTAAGVWLSHRVR